MIMNHNTSNYVGLVKQANLFTKMFGLGKKVDDSKPLFWFTRQKHISDFLPEGFEYESGKLPRPTRFFDMNDDPYTPEGTYFRQPKPEDYAMSDGYVDYANRKANPDDAWIDPHIPAPGPGEKFKMLDPNLKGEEMHYGSHAYRIKLFHQLMDKLNLQYRARGSNKNAYDDIRTIAKMQRYADTMVRSQGYGKHL